MPWKMRYQVFVEWVPAGVGPMSGSLSPLSGQVGGGGLSQVLEFLNTAPTPATVAGGGAGNALQSADITTLLNSMTTDLSTQMNAQLGRLNGFQTGAG